MTTPIPKHWLALAGILLWLLGCQSATIETPTTPSSTLTPTSSAQPIVTPTLLPTIQAAPLASLPLAYSTAEGVFLWNPPAAERTQIASEPAARLSWSSDGTWLATTRHPFIGTTLNVQTADGALKTHTLKENFTFAVWSPDSKEIVALPCPATSSRLGDFQIVDPARGPSRVATSAEIWSWLPNVAPDQSKVLLFPFNRPFTPSAIIVFDDWRRAPLLLDEIQFPACPDAYSWSSNSRYLSYYSMGRFWILDFAESGLTPRPIAGPATAEPINVVAPALAWSPTGKQLALALKGELWLADVDTLNAKRIEGFAGIFSGLSWAPSPRRGKSSSDGVLSQLMPYVNPGDFYNAFVQIEGRPQPRIIAASTDVIRQAPFVYVDYRMRKAVLAPPSSQLNCPSSNSMRLLSPAVQLSSERTGESGQEALVVTGGWYMFLCKGRLVYRWDGSRFELVEETRVSP